MSTPDLHARAPRRGARPRARWIAPLIAVAALSAGVATRGAIGAEGTPAPAAEPPTAAEVRAWEAEFLRAQGGAKTIPPATATKASGKQLSPQSKVLSLYGAAGGFGVLGRKSLNGAAKKLNRQIKPYRRKSDERVVKAFDLVSVIATQCSGRHDKCRSRVNDSIIRRYLSKIRELNGRLVLDIQPGRADVLDEIDHLRNFIREPDVDVAIDAEWNMGRSEVPGEDLGSISARKVNAVIDQIRRIMSARDLPPKLLIIHQFRKSSINSRKDIRLPDNLDVTINFDGIGSPSAKRAGYRQISSNRHFNGFSLFYQLDDRLMDPNAVLGLRPEVDYVMYQ